METVNDYEDETNSAKSNNNLQRYVLVTRARHVNWMAYGREGDIDNPVNLVLRPGQGMSYHGRLKKRCERNLVIL